MSKVLTGIYGRPLGKTAGVVWSAARTATGKVATTREYVIPADPKTADQTERRNIFQACSYVMNNLGSAIWQASWNNTKGLLPGYHGMISWLLDNALYTAGPAVDYPDAPSAKSLGPCYNPGIAGATGGAEEITLTWDKTIVGDHCALTDPFIACCFPQDAMGDWPGTDTIDVSDGITRDDETATLTTDSAIESSWVAWFRHDEGDGTYTYSPITASHNTSGA